MEKAASPQGSPFFFSRYAKNLMGRERIVVDANLAATFENLV